MKFLYISDLDGTLLDNCGIFPDNDKFKINELIKMLENEKIKSIDLKLYGTARHSLALEVKSIKDRFYNDMLTWLNDKIKKLK